MPDNIINIQFDDSDEREINVALGVWRVVEIVSVILRNSNRTAVYFSISRDNRRTYAAIEKTTTNILGSNICRGTVKLKEGDDTIERIVPYFVDGRILPRYP